MSPYPFLFCARLGWWIAEVEHYIYFQLPVTYRTDRITQTVLFIRWVDGGQSWTCIFSITRRSNWANRPQLFSKESFLKTSRKPAITVECFTFAWKHGKWTRENFWIYLTLELSIIILPNKESKNNSRISRNLSCKIFKILRQLMILNLTTNLLKLSFRHSVSVHNNFAWFHSSVYVKLLQQFFSDTLHVFNHFLREKIKLEKKARVACLFTIR